MPVDAPSTADHSSSGFNQISEDDCGGTITPQGIGLATCTARGTDIQEKEKDDWQLFKETFEQDVPETSTLTDFLSSTVVKQLRQNLIADLMLSFHDAQFGSEAGKPAQVEEHTSQTNSTLSFARLDLVEQSIDHLLKECECNEDLREKLSATSCSTVPLYEAYNSGKAGDDLMQELVAHHMQSTKKCEVSTTTSVQAAIKLEPENAPAVVFTASTTSKL